MHIARDERRNPIDLGSRGQGQLWSQEFEHKQVHKRGTESVVWKAKRSMLTCHTRCKCSMETTRNKVKLKFDIKVVKLVECLIDRKSLYLVRVRMSCNIRERELNKIPIYRP